MTKNIIVSKKDLKGKYMYIYNRMCSFRAQYMEYKLAGYSLKIGTLLKSIIGFSLEIGRIVCSAICWKKGLVVDRSLFRILWFNNSITKLTLRLLHMYCPLLITIICLAMITITLRSTVLEILPHSLCCHRDTKYFCCHLYIRVD